MPEVVIQIPEKHTQWINPKHPTVSHTRGMPQSDKATALDTAKTTVVSDIHKPVSFLFPNGDTRQQYTSHIDTQQNAFSQEIARPPEGTGTAAWIEYFDINWRKENLSEDWFNLKTQNSKRVGFILDQQMGLLKDPYDKEELLDWTMKTKRDLEGFKLEFLSDKVVYPRKYFWNKRDKKLEDPLYGKAKDGSNFAKIAEIVSDQERNGSVVQSLEKIQEFLADASEGAIAVMTSPLGPTGFRTQDGLSIDYPDSYFFVMVNTPEGVMNYTIKTDFKLLHCREAIFHLTGILLPDDAPLEEYGQTLALIQPGQYVSIKNVFDVVSVLETVQGSHAFIDQQNDKKTSWGEVRKQIGIGEDLYRFDVESTAILNEFEQFGKEGVHSKEELLKGISATILRLGEHFFRKTPSEGKEIELREKVWESVKAIPKKLFGTVLEETAERRGCSGGGSSKSALVNTIGGPRRGEARKEWFNCPKCGFKANGPVGDSCPGCGLTKEAYAESGGEVC